MKKTISLIIALAMLFTLALTGCGGTSDSGGGSANSNVNNSSSTTPGNSSNTTPDDGSGTSSGGDVWGDTYYEFSFATADNENAGPSVGTKAAIEYITEKSEGHIKITPYYGGTLVESPDLLDAVGNGVADIVYVTPTLYTGAFNVMRIVAQTFTRQMPAPSGLNEITREAVDTIPAFQEEAAGLGCYILDLTVTPGIIFGCHGDDAADINTPDDLKGYVVAATGNFALALEEYGASSISSGPADWYTDFERDLVDVHSASWALASDFGLRDVFGSYVTFGESGLGTTPQACLINLDKWSTLPEHVQELLIEGFRYGYTQTAVTNEEVEARVSAEEAELGKVIHNIEPEDMEPWYALSEVSMGFWAKDVDTAGFDSAQIREAYDKIVEDYMAAHPAD